MFSTVFNFYNYRASVAPAKALLLGTSSEWEGGCLWKTTLNVS